jgi:phosphopantothenoylcysteine decarboxylase/phosphopantothenate--cysteine ligase
VTLIAANVSDDAPPGVRRVDVQSAAQLADAVGSEFPGCHVLLMAAAVADFRPAEREGKLAREGSGGLDLHLEETEDVLARAAAERTAEQTLVGFAAEHGADAIERAREKLRRKGVHAIVFNDISRPEIGFDSEHNEVTIVTEAAERRVPLAGKDEVADAILDEVAALRDSLRIR